MKRLLGVVKENIDLDNQKRIQATIVGLTDDIPSGKLPWAFPLDDQCIIPDVDDKVWVYVDQMDPTEAHDFNRLWYRRFTEETYKECYDMENSDTYLLKKANRDAYNEDVDNNKGVLEPNITSSVDYPKNKVIKYGGFTIEFDEGNTRLCITDVDGNYHEWKDGNVTSHHQGIVKEFIDKVKITQAKAITLTTKDGKAALMVDSLGFVNIYSEESINLKGNINLNGNKGFIVTAAKPGLIIPTQGGVLQSSSTVQAESGPLP